MLLPLRETLACSVTPVARRVETLLQRTLKHSASEGLPLDDRPHHSAIRAQAGLHHPALQIILSRITHQIRPKHNAVWMAPCPDEVRSGLFRARISCSVHPRGLQGMLGTNFMLDLIPFIPRTIVHSVCSYSFDFAVNTLFHSVLISSSAFLSSHEQALAIWLIVSPVTYDHFFKPRQPTLIV